VYGEITRREENTMKLTTNHGRTIQGDPDQRKMKEKIAENVTGCKHDKKDHQTEQK
jgi:hypothetical protein